ncbi:uncharacterized protein [Amphiura filiformis]|uniref:uncharacterized protein n=1 Tax=Amphiura filiformis TaxID=82378 RepID=UPI003B22322B
MALLPKALEIPRKIMDQAEMLQLSQQHQSDQKIENLTNIADSTTVTILGQITELKEIQTFPSKYPPFQDVEVRNGNLSDDTGCVEFALWRKLAASKIQVGDTVRLHQMTKSTSTYAGTSRPKITSGRYTSIEHTVAAFNIKEPEDNFAEDGVIEAALNAALYTLLAASARHRPRKDSFALDATQQSHLLRCQGVKFSSNKRTTTHQ